MKAIDVNGFRYFMNRGIICPTVRRKVITVSNPGPEP